MARSTLPPITREGELRNREDRLLLAAIAIGLPIEAHCDAYDESKEGANRALQRLAATLLAKDRYGVLVWVMNRDLLDFDELTRSHPPEAYQSWLAIVEALDANHLTPEQVAVLLGYVGAPHKTIHTHWSQPERFPEIKGILDHVHLPATGRLAYAMVLAAAAHLKQAQWENIPEQGTASMFRTPAGVTISLSGPPGAVQETLQVIRAALGLKEWPADVTGPAD